MVDNSFHADRSHPTDEQLRDFVSGQEMGDDLHRRLASHLVVCQRCEYLAASFGPDRIELRLRSASPSSEPLQKLSAGYELMEEIGRGAAGIVYRARHHGLGRFVAIKMLLGGSNATPPELARFKRESEALARLHHPNIVQVFDVGEMEGVPFLAMEWVDGQSLAEHLRHRPVTPRESARIVAALARAVSHAHHQGVLHRDLKPQNVLVAHHDLSRDSRERENSALARESGTMSLSDDMTELKVVDFGLARLTATEGFQTRTGESLGTPAYMAPEQVRGGSDRIGESTDVYGLGAILYECLTGRPPFHGGSPLETMQMVLDCEPVSIDSLRPGTPRDLSVICHRCLAKTASLRFGSAEELSDDLQRFLENKPILSRPVGVIQRAVRWGRRNPWPVATALLSVGAVIAMVLGQWVYQVRLTRQRDDAIENYQAVRSTLWHVLDAANAESSFDIPRLRELSANQMMSALSLFESLAVHDDSPQALLDLGNIQLRCGSTLIADRDYERGQSLIEKAKATFDVLFTQSPSDAETLGGVVSSHVKLAHPLMETGKVEESLQLLRATLPLAEQLRERFPNSAHHADLVAWTQHNLGTALVAKGDHASGAEAFVSAVAIRRKACELDSGNDDLLRRLAESQISLGVCQMALQSPEANESYVAAIRSLKQILEGNPKDVQTMIAIAIAELNRSNILAGEGDAKGAVSVCTSGIELCRRILNVEPNHAVAKNYASMLHGNRAIFSSQTGDKANAVADWRTAILESVDDATRDFCRLMLVSDLASLARLDEAIHEARQLDIERLDDASRFHLASAWAAIVRVTAKTEIDSDPATDTCLGEINVLLRKLSENGYFEVDPAAAESVANGEEFRSFRDLLAPEKVDQFLAIQSGEASTP